MSVLAAPVAVRSIVAAGRQGNPEPAYPIVIVGAGLAGLRAAALLQQAGKRVVVLEARSVPGGRVRTLRTPFDDGLYAEAGPIRIAGLHRRVLEIISQYKLTLLPFAGGNGSAVVTVGARTWRVPDDIKAVGEALELTATETGLSQGALLRRYLTDPAEQDLPMAVVDRRRLGYDRVTWPDWLQSRGASAGAVRLMTLGGDSRQLSALYVFQQVTPLQDTQQFYKIQGGMDQLPRAMAKGLGPALRYDSPAVRIDHSTTPIRVQYVERGRTRRTIEASRLVLAVPFSVLRHIEIQPRLRGVKADVIEELPYFPATRFLLQSRTRFWEASGLSGSARTDQPAEIWDCAYDLPGTRGILGATVGGEIGSSLSGMTRSRAIAFGVDLVSATFPDLRASFEKGSVYRWALDPWSRGAFAVFHPGQMTSMMPEIPRPDGRIHFAGEHTSSWMGWMEGALESGERVAREILT